MKLQKGLTNKSGKKSYLIWISEDAYKKAVMLKKSSIKDFCNIAILHYAAIKEAEKEKASSMIVEKENL